MKRAMSYLPDLISLLQLDPKCSDPCYGSNIRTIVIGKDYTNAGDFAFSSVLNHLSRGRNNPTSTLLITTSHSFSHYSSCAAKCGVNLGLSTGNIKLMNIMEEVLELKNYNSQHWMEYIAREVSSFVACATEQTRSLNVMIDDITSFYNIGLSRVDITHLFHTIHTHLDKHQSGCNYFIVQGLNIDSFILSLANFSDIFLLIQPLNTGFSKLVDGTISIFDNRVPKKKDASPTNTIDNLTSRLTGRNKFDIGCHRELFFKLSERKVKLTLNVPNC